MTIDGKLGIVAMSQEVVGNVRGGKLCRHRFNGS
jgi:hypothetical protein